MRFDTLLLSLTHLMIVFFMFALGLLVVIVPHAPLLCQRLALFLLAGRTSVYFYATGITLLFAALGLMIGFYQLHKRQYYTVEMKGSKASIEKSIIRDYVKEYWSNLFEGQDLLLDVLIEPKQKIHIIAQFPLSEKEETLKRVENELGVLLARKLGYEKEFLLTITST